MAGVFTANATNTLLQVPTSVKYYVMCSLEFGLENEGNINIMQISICGDKDIGRDFRNHLQSCITHLDFKPCLANPDAWKRSAIK